MEIYSQPAVDPIRALVASRRYRAVRRVKVEATRHSQGSLHSSTTRQLLLSTLFTTRYLFASTQRTPRFNGFESVHDPHIKTSRGLPLDNDKKVLGHGAASVRLRLLGPLTVEGYIRVSQRPAALVLQRCGGPVEDRATDHPASPADLIRSKHPTHHSSITAKPNRSPNTIHERSCVRAQS